MADKQDAINTSCSSLRVDTSILPSTLENIVVMTAGETHAGLCRLVEKMERGFMKDTAPITPKEIDYCKKELQDWKEELGKEVKSYADKKVEAFSDLLVKAFVHVHYSQVASHRANLQHVLDLLLLCNAIDPDSVDRIKQLVAVHDLSKYVRDGPVGYAIMFGPTGKFRELSEQESALWEASLQNHYRHNPHHPQYHRKEGSDDLLPMGEEYIIESVIDMLACELERNYQDGSIIPVKHFFCLDEKFLQRYIPSDKVEVKRHLHVFQTKCVSVVINRTTNKQFDEKLKEWEKKVNKKLTVNN